MESITLQHQSPNFFLCSELGTVACGWLLAAEQGQCPLLDGPTYCRQSWAVVVVVVVVVVVCVGGHLFLAHARRHQLLDMDQGFKIRRTISAPWPGV
jgi:hypothetical protein